MAPFDFVSSPDSRGTLDILWNSLSTIVACTWTLQHLNIPEQRNGRDPGWVGGLRWKLGTFFRNAKWMLWTIIAPGFVVGMASYDLFLAWIFCRKLQKFALEDGIPWTLTHAYFANMGGFVIQSSVQEAPHETPFITTETTLANNNSTNIATVNLNRSLEHKVVENSLSAKFLENGKSLTYHNTYHLTGAQIYKLRRKRILPRLPQISEAELRDRSKSDSFVKIIAILQIIWATTQIIVRATRKLLILQLELAAIAYAACAIPIYLLYWPKPQSINTTITILRYRDRIPGDVLRLVKDRSVRFVQIFFLTNVQESRFGTRIRNDAIDESINKTEHGGLIVLWMALGTTLFGGIVGLLR